MKNVWNVPAFLCNIIREHLGLLESQGREPHAEISVEDPVIDEFYLETWIKSAEQNTAIYEEVRLCQSYLHTPIPCYSVMA